MRKRIIRNGVKRAIAFVASLSLVVTSNGFGMTGGGVGSISANLSKQSW